MILKFVCLEKPERPRLVSSVSTPSYLSALYQLLISDAALYQHTAIRRVVYTDHGSPIIHWLSSASCITTGSLGKYNSKSNTGPRTAAAEYGVSILKRTGLKGTGVSFAPLGMTSL